MDTAHLCKRQTGFSLIEIMVVITIMALISVMAWQGIDSMQRSQSILQQRADDQTQVLRALQQFERDWAWGTRVELAQDAGWYLGPEMAPKDKFMLLPASILLGSAKVPRTIEWVRAAPAAPGQWLRVRWWLKDHTLYRSVGFSAAYYPLVAPNEEQAVPVLEGVRSFRVRAWEPGYGWREVPHSASVTQQATGIELSVTRVTQTGRALTYRRVFPFV
ncbi:prepilin-type N-terminal cleavage/methylation domain-containing protein [Alcaligenes endophyticus]|uniref:Prepilin-type N-terminal cleavage/methylation domain-containing protein n=1 Tax=Alcaligenes endophyticus TaxID=1929088 RepID=A0ABT8EKF4_9BURK|nr:prepilin-type N-terminal cleavage/methylation domain-containing protein [Alcaligenes endophyticus]MCX5590873.1 prepilin-type N-terminal cleavage/methylation domain-containing protein [Alcaligenes endophyticus]MDN4121764.1 prepilin-type N-terminal cleavage/methylation domain-containing protein [Alcaligenes endophyticus]